MRRPGARLPGTDPIRGAATRLSGTSKGLLHRSRDHPVERIGFKKRQTPSEPLSPLGVAVHLGRTAAGAPVRSSRRKRRPEAASSATLPPVAALPPASGLRFLLREPGSPPEVAFPGLMHRCTRAGPAGSVSFSNRSGFPIRALALCREASLPLRRADLPFFDGPATDVPVPLIRFRPPVGSPLPACKKKYAVRAPMAR